MYITTAQTAKVIRTELKKAFPNVKFSVTSKNYSGGSSIYVKWVDGPTEKMVKAITSQFSEISYDHATGEILSGGNSYVFASREISEAGMAIAKQDKIYSAYVRQYGEGIDWIEHHLGRVLCDLDFTAVEEVKNETIEIEASEIVENEVENAVVEASAVEGVKVEMNEELNGIEISFESKPAQETISALKEAGFRWHKVKKVWYAKQSEERNAFAAALVGQVEEINAIEENEVESVSVENEVFEIIENVEIETADPIAEEIAQLEATIKAAQERLEALKATKQNESEVSSASDSVEMIEQQKEEIAKIEKLEAKNQVKKLASEFEIIEVKRQVENNTIEIAFYAKETQSKGAQYSEGSFSIDLKEKKERLFLDRDDIKKEKFLEMFRKQMTESPEFRIRLALKGYTVNGFSK